MSHTLYTGSFVELQDLFLEQVAASRRQNPLAPLTVLVPGQLVRASLSRELTRSGCPHANIRFTTVYETAQRLAEPVLRPNKLQPVKDVTRDLLIQKAIDDSRDKLTYFARIADFSGFRTKLLSTLSDLSGACVTIPMLIEAAKSELRDLRSSLAQKLKEIALLWHSYNTLLDENNLVERASVIGHAADEVLNKNDSHPLILYGLDELTELELRFLERFWQNRETTIYHPWQDSPGYEFTQDLLTRYQNCGFTDNTAVKKQMQPGTLLSKIQFGLFQELTPSEQNPDYSDSSISLYSTPDTHREAQETIRAVLYSPDVASETSAVLTRTAKPYTDYLRSAAREAKVQPYFHECRTLGDSLTGIALHRFIILLNGNFRRIDVADFLLCGKLKQPESLADCQQELPVTEWNQFALLSGVTAGRDNWTINLERFKNSLQWKAEHANPEDETGTRKLSEQLLSLEHFVSWLDLLFTKVEAVRNSDSFSEFVATLRTTIEEMTDCDEIANEIFDQLDQAAQLDQTSFRLSTQSMISCIESALRSPLKREGRYQESEPTIATVQQTRGVIFDNVYLIGLTEGEFPRASSQDPVLLDNERELLSHELSQGTFAIRIPQLSTLADREAYYFASAIDSARKHIHLSFTRVGASGRETLPSRFLLDAMTVIHGKVADASLLNEFIKSHYASRHISRQDHAPVTDSLSSREFDSSLIYGALSTKQADRLASLQSSSLFRRVLTGEHARSHQKSFTKYEGILEDSLRDSDTNGLIRKIVSVLSASQLETYWTCPFQWFASRVLELRLIEEPDILKEHDSLIRGSLIHSILEKFYRAEKKAGHVENLTEADWPQLHDFTLGELAEFELQQPVGLFMLWTREKQKILELLRHFFLNDIKGRDGFFPHRFEWRFGDEQHQVKLKLTDEKSLYFHGAIDRIDQHQDGRLRILDYKSGKNNSKLKTDNLLARRALQLHIYKFAAEFLLKQKVESASYYFMRESSKPRVELTETEATETSDRLKSVLRILDNEMRSGNCRPYPDNEVCRFCGVASACGQGRFTKKWEMLNEQDDYQRIREGGA